MRHTFEDFFDMNILNWKISQNIISIRTWNQQKAEFLSEITLLLLLKFEYTSYMFPIPSI